MTLSYANQNLACPNAASRDWLAQHFKLCDLTEWAAATWPGYARQKWAGWTSSHLRDSLRPVKVNSLWWPNGASRFAVGHFLVGSKQLAKIRSATSNGTAAATLKMSSRTRRPNGTFATSTITPEMWMLPPRPLADCPGVPSALSSLFLLTLVDARFFFWFKSASISVTGGTTTWATLLAAVNSVLGTSASVGPYTTLKPSEQLTSHYEHLPQLLDAVAHNTGGRVVRSLDGVTAIQAPDTAKASQDAQLEYWSKEAGGVFALDAAKAGQDFGVMVPATVRVTFKKVTTSGELLDGVHSETKTLSVLSLTDYYPMGYAGKSGDVKLYTDDAYAIYDDSADVTPNNLADLQALATAMATAFYKFAAGRQSTRFGGIVPYAPEALSDSAEWVYEAGVCYTLVQRGPWNDLADRLNHYTADDPVECCPEYWCVADTTTADTGHYDGKYYRWDDATNAVLLVGDCWIKMLNGQAPELSTYYACAIEDTVTISASARRRAVVADRTDFIAGEEDNGTVVSPMRFLNVLKTTGLYLDDAGGQQGNLGLFTFTSADGTVAITLDTATQTIDLSALCCKGPETWWCILVEGGSGSGPGVVGDCPCDDVGDMALTVSGSFVPEMNAVHTLNYGGLTPDGPCSWIGSVTVAGETSPWPIMLYYHELVSTWYLEVRRGNGTLLWEWELANGSWTCCAANAMTRVSGMDSASASVDQTCGGSGSGGAGMGSGGEFTTRCFLGTAAEAALEGTVVGGPWATFDLCEAACEPTGSGGGGGSGAGGGPGLTACCPANEISGTLLATFSMKTGDFTSLVSSATLYYDAGPDWWFGQFESGLSCDTGTSGDEYLRLQCFPDGEWQLSAPSTMTSTRTLVSIDCDPFEIVFDVEATGTAPACNGTFRVTITEAP